MPETSAPAKWPSAKRRISPSFIVKVCERLEQGRAVRRSLPGGGRLHIDRALPFMCVYREPSNATVGQTSQLVIGEAAHLIAPGSQELHPRLLELVAGISNIMIQKFGAFLLLEVWTAKDGGESSDDARNVPDPTFRIVSPLLPIDDPTVRELKKALSNIPLRPPPLDVEVETVGSPAPPDLEELLSSKPGKTNACSVVGIEVQPVYRQARTGTPYPVLFETLQRGLSLAIRQTAYHFAQLHTGHAPTHYHALGRRTAVRAVQEVDEALTDISRSFDFLLQVTPVNAERARLQLHALAVQLLETIARSGAGEDDDDAPEAEGIVNAARFAAMAEDELARYREEYSGLAATVHVRSDVAGLLVSEGDLLIGAEFRATETRARALLQHEIGTHVISHSNGLAQPLSQLASGLAGYEETQEGLAVASEYLVGALTPNRVRVLAGRVVAVRALVDGAPFVDCYRLLTGGYQFAPSTAFTICMRVYRSGGLTKDAIYLRGLQDFLAYLRAGRDLEPLLLGKLAISDVPAIEELRWRKYLKPPRLIPHFLTAPGAEGAMRRLRRGHSLFQLVTEITQ